MHGSVGIGLTLVAGPTLIAIDDAFAPGPVLLAGQLVSIRHLVMERAHLDTTAFGHCLLGLPFGILAGVVILEMVTPSVLAVIIGALTAAAALALLTGARVGRTRPTEIGAGAACSLASVTAGLPGPPLVIAFSDMGPPTMRATSAASILTVAVIGFTALVVTGNFGDHEAALTGWLLPGVVAGLVLARRVRPHVDRGWFRTAVLVVALAGGLALIARQAV